MSVLKRMSLPVPPHVTPDTECGSTPEHIYGGTDGILAMVNLRPQIERGAQSVNKLVGTITWSAKFSAERNINPYAA